VGIAFAINSQWGVLEPVGSFIPEHADPDTISGQLLQGNSA